MLTNKCKKSDIGERNIMNNYKNMILPMALSIVLLGCSSSASLAVSKDSSTTSPEKQEIIVVDNDKKSKVP